MFLDGERWIRESDRNQWTPPTRRKGIRMQATETLTTETPLWDSLPSIVQDNLDRQHKEAGILELEIPPLKVARDDEMEPYKKAVSDIEEALEKLGETRLKTSLKGDFVKLRDKEAELLTALAVAKDARNKARKACEANKGVNKYNAFLKASAYIRTQQVVTVKGPLTAVPMTPEMEAEIEAISSSVKRADALRKYARQALMF